MELSLPGMPSGVGGDARSGTEAGKPCDHRRRRKLSNASSLFRTLYWIKL